MTGLTYNPHHQWPRGSTPLVVLRNTGLSRGARLLYGILSSYSGRDGRCYPSHGQLAKDLGVTDRQVRTYLGELRRAGLISWKKGPRHRSCSYYFRPPSPDKPEADFRSNRKQTSAQTGSRLPTNKNYMNKRKTPPHPPFMGEVCSSELSEIFWRMRERHLKKGRVKGAWWEWLKRIGEAPAEGQLATAQRIDRQHERFCRYQAAQGVEVRFWPSLDRWLREKRDYDRLPELEDPMAKLYDESKE